MSKSETSKATGRPVTRVPWRIVVEAGGKIVGDETEADSHKHPGGYTIRLHGANATVATVYRPGDAVTIRERVNGWEALEAELARLDSERAEAVELLTTMKAHDAAVLAENARLRAALERLVSEGREAVPGATEPGNRYDEGYAVGFVDAQRQTAAAARAALEGGR